MANPLATVCPASYNMWLELVSVTFARRISTEGEILLSDCFILFDLVFLIIDCICLHVLWRICHSYPGNRVLNPSL